MINPFTYHGRAWLLSLAWLLTLSQLLAQSPLTVTGRVTDKTGQVIPGATVLLKGTTNGTTTSAEGTYRLSVPSSKATLVVSYVGYLSLESAIMVCGVIVALYTIAGGLWA